MRTSHLFTQCATLLCLCSLATAWPWPPSLEGIENLIGRRDDNSNSTATQSASDSGSGTITASPTGSGSASASASGSDNKNDASKTDNSSSETTVIDPRLAAGGIQMVTPPASLAAVNQYYKVGDFVTFAWNYTSLSVSPKAIDIVATCSSNQHTYTLAMNQSVGETNAVTWDTGAYQKTATIPLLTESYTLIIYDAAKDVSATAQAGYLGQAQFPFAMYTPQPYTPLSDYTCATCSGALSDMERQALKFMFGMGIITVLSFTWFVGGLGVMF
ncbi:MAG: hypothetical protein M1812_003305 [Candelaria pacifica]|nr:MAG: hypothetical protein M1812_003305 [Candelaria pacifica]